VIRVHEPLNAWTTQGLRYVVVGVASNAALYCIYLALTRFGMGPKSAMSLAYVVGVLQTFYLQRRWTFAHDGRFSVSLARYLSAYALCYLGNLATLAWFVDVLGWPHAAVQAGAIVGFALILFLLQKFWIFRQSDRVAITLGSEK
jgi:putative flippase GtrA